MQHSSRRIPRSDTATTPGAPRCQSIVRAVKEDNTVQSQSAAAPVRHSPSTDPDPRLGDQTMRRNVGLVHFVARNVSASGVHDLEYDELVSAGSIGLAKAVESFDPNQGYAFSTYATTRIRGAILDELRSRDWLPRSARRRHRAMSAAVDRLEARLGRAASSREIAAELQVDVETYWRWQTEINQRCLVDLDAPVQGASGDRVPLSDILPDPTAVEPLNAMTAESGDTNLKYALAGLPERDRTVFALYYNEKLTLRQIAEVLGITESRVSQIRTAAIRKLRGRIVDLAA